MYYCIVRAFVADIKFGVGIEGFDVNFVTVSVAIEAFNEKSIIFNVSGESFGVELRWFDANNYNAKILEQTANFAGK